MPTRLQIKQDVVRVLKMRDEALATLPVPLVATAAGSTTTIIDAKLGRGTLQTNRYDARSVELTDQVASVTINTSSVASPTVITTAAAHGLTTGDTVTISGHTSVTPDINGEHVITVTAGTTFTIVVNVTDGGIGGTVQQLAGRAGVDDSGFNISTSTLTFSPAVGSVVTSAPYILYPLGLGPEVVNEAISEILRNTSAPTIYFPALNSDPMMNESTTLADHWTDVGSPTTTEFITSEATTGTEDIFIGEQSIQVNPASAGDGIRTLTFDVHERETVYVTCFVRAATGSVIVTLIDVTNSSAPVEPGAITIDEPSWTEVSFIATVPNDCEQMHLQFTAVDASDDMFIGAPCLVQSRSGRSHSMPSWFTHKSQFIEAHYLPQGMNSEDEFTFIPLSNPSRIHPSMNFIEEARAIHPIKVEFDARVSRPVYLIATREFDDITTNSATTNADREYMRNRVLATILRDWVDPAYGFWAHRAGKRGRKVGYSGRSIQIEPNTMVAV